MRASASDIQSYFARNLPEMPSLPRLQPHTHGRACDDEIFAMWERFFIPLTGLAADNPASPFLAWPVHAYFSQLVVPQVVCPRLRAWLLVYLADPAFSRSTTLRRGARAVGDMAFALQDWWNAGLLTRLWFSEGAPRLIDLANARGLHYLNLQ